MMLIPTRVLPSGIHGLGLFAVEGVRRGAAIWRFEPGFDQVFSPAQLAVLPPEAQRHLRWFAFQDAGGGWVLSGDHACFMNHSPAPNTGAPPNANAPTVTTALRDIAAGEELTCDYFAFDAEARGKLGPGGANS
jgi:SET domain-containing protein